MLPDGTRLSLGLLCGPGQIRCNACLGLQCLDGGNPEVHFIGIDADDGDAAIGHPIG